MKREGGAGFEPDNTHRRQAGGVAVPIDNNRPASESGV